MMQILLECAAGRDGRISDDALSGCGISVRGFVDDLYIL